MRIAAPGIHKAPGTKWKYKEVPTEGTWTIAYGKDHACGYFIQFYPVDEKAQEICNANSDGECLDLDQIFGNLEAADYLSILYDFGINEYM